MIKDLPFQLKHCYLILKKRRYRCSCGKRFFESYDFLARYQQRSVRLTKYVVNELRETVSVKSIAKRSNLSTTTITRILDTLHYTCSPIKESISIDEFRGNTNAGKFQCILVNPNKNYIMDILPSRSQVHLSAYFKEISKKDRHLPQCKCDY
jgi:transposase